MATKEEYYARAIDILMEGGINAKAMVIAIAKKNPQLFCELYDSCDPEAQERADLDRQLIALLSAGKIVEAIKLRRSKTGEGLKEAKGYCDELRSKMARDAEHELGSVAETLFKEEIGGVGKW